MKRVQIIYLLENTSISYVLLFYNELTLIHLAFIKFL